MDELPTNLWVRGNYTPDGEVEGMDIPSDDDEDDCFLPDEDESSDSSDVEDILIDYDSDGLPKKNPEDSRRGVPKLPPGFQVQVAKKQRRFRKAYAGPSIAAYDLFTKPGGMTKLSGKLDRKLEQAANDFLAPGTDDDAGMPSVSGSIKTDVNSWLLGTAYPTSPDAIKLKLSTIFFTHWATMKTENSRSKRNVLFREIFSAIQNVRSLLIETSLHVISTKLSLQHFNEVIEEKIAEKSTMIDYMQLYRLTKMVTPPEFDESSNWGLKPLRHTLMPPYFKNWGGQIAAPPAFKRTPISRLIILMTSTKQKWTVKDLTELQSSIRKTVLERRLVEAKELADQFDEHFQTDQSSRNSKILNALNNPKTKEELKENWLRKARNGRARARAAASARNNKIPMALMSPAFDDIPCALRSCKNSADVRKWYKRECERIESVSYNEVFDEDENFTVDNVDWDAVSALLMSRTKKLRLAEDCRNCFAHAANPKFCNKRRWSHKEKEVLKKISDKNKEWVELSRRLPLPRPEFVVFYKWKKTLNRPKKMHWGPEKIDLTKNKLESKRTTNWNKLPVELNDFAATKKQVQERFKKTLNPVLRFGKFTRVEDSLMLLTIEKLKGQFRREKHFGILTAFLPWRYESAWRDRVENLFSEYIVPWTLAEDKKLMQLARTMKRDWSKISQEFNSFKTRKGCLTRFKILEKRLVRFKTLEQYHDAYAMIRYNVREYQHLKDISALLKKIMDEEVYIFSGLPRDRSPTEEELQEFILSFDRDVMASTIQMIDTYVMKRDEYWSEWREKNGVEQGTKRKTHDRRTFHVEDTQSIASALHIREVKLRPQESLKFKLTPRESQIYGFYARFCSTKALKRNTKRPYIPLADDLVTLPDVRRIVVKEDPEPEDSVRILSGRKRKAAKLPGGVVPKKGRYQFRRRR